MNPINQELRDLRRMIEHYNSIIQLDSKIKNGEIENTDNRQLLSKTDKKDINNKLNALYEKRRNLLLNDNEYNI